MGEGRWDEVVDRTIVHDNWCGDHLSGVKVLKSGDGEDRRESQRVSGLSPESSTNHYGNTVESFYFVYTLFSCNSSKGLNPVLFI